MGRGVICSVAMKPISVGLLLKGSIWTIAAHGVGQALRLLTNVILARLLAPELFGIMLIVNSLRTGMTLMSDFGIGQNIIYNRHANQPEFYSTAWTLEIVRNTVLWLVAVAATPFVANLYQSSVLLWALPLSAFALVLTGFSSPSLYLLQKRMQLARYNLFDMIMTFLSSAAHIVLAYFSPTIWALVLGGLFSSAASTVGSYFLLPEVRPRFHISREFIREILSFGKWIFISSAVYFFSMNYDRLYLPKLFPLALLGVYGVARSLSELLTTLTMRLGNVVLFPFIASHSQMSRESLQASLAGMRARFLLLAAIGISILVATADLAIRVLYDERYQAAGWMLPLMMLGSWFSILASVNDSTLLGLGKPLYGAIANSTKFAFLAVGLPLGFVVNGVLGVVVVFAISDLCRYVPIFLGQRSERIAFGMQDMLLTLCVFALIGVWEWLRWLSGLGTSFDALSQQ
jgi:O-antigen/teichoic acid export membrane protein